MVVTPMWKLRVLRFLGDVEFWLRNFFSTPKARAERYRQAVAEEAFETWMNSGRDFAKTITGRIEAAQRRGEHNSVRFWQDVLVSAHDFDSYPENRRQREETIHYVDEPEAAA